MATQLIPSVFHCTGVTYSTFDRTANPVIIHTSPRQRGYGFSSPSQERKSRRTKSAALLRARPPMAGRAGSLAARRSLVRSTNQHGSVCLPLLRADAELFTRTGGHHDYSV